MIHSTRHVVHALNYSNSPASKLNWKAKGIGWYYSNPKHTTWILLSPFFSSTEIHPPFWSKNILLLPISVEKRKISISDTVLLLAEYCTVVYLMSPYGLLTSSAQIYYSCYSRLLFLVSCQSNPLFYGVIPGGLDKNGSQITPWAYNYTRTGTKNTVITTHSSPPSTHPWRDLDCPNTEKPLVAPFPFAHWDTDKSLYSPK